MRRGLCAHRAGGSSHVTPRRVSRAHRAATPAPAEMLRRAALALALLAAAAWAQEAPLAGGNAGSSANAGGNATAGATATPCAACCAPGGSCDAAFKGTPGVCCGLITDRPFCCPTVGTSFGAAICYRTGDAFRCRTSASPSRSTAPRPVVVTTNDRGVSWAWWLFFLVVPFLLLLLCFYSIASARSRAKDTPVMVALTPQQQGPGGASPSYGYPVTGQPVYVGQQGAAAGGGTSPWLAGGAGLLGGYMLGSTLAGAHQPAYGGAYYGGGGGDFAATSDMGGGGFGGGGGDFAADS